MRGQLAVGHDTFPSVLSRCCPNPAKEFNSPTAAPSDHRRCDSKPPPANMAAPSIMVAEVLPRFLLPRLSWGSAVAASRALRPLAIQTRDRTPGYLAPFHVASSPKLRRAPQAQSPILRRAFHATAVRQRDHHFDTLKFVQRLQGEGFTEEQSVAMMKVLNDVIEER